VFGKEAMADRFLRILFAILSAVLAFTRASVPPARGQSPDDQRLVLAFYYTWFDENTWSPELVPDMPVTPYVSRDRATMERHVAQAQAAGIDAFVVSWWGPQEENNQTETNLRTLLDVAADRGFRVTVDFELTSPFYANQADVTAALRHLLDTHAQHPAFLRRDGQPVIFFWRQQRYDAATWAAMRQQIDPARASLWIAEGVYLSYLDVFDGLHLYNVTWNPPTDPLYTATKFRGRIDAYNTAHTTQKLWIATVMPGYDDTHIAGRANTYAHPRQGGDYYRETWQAALASAPDMVIVTSFNEWREGTMIEPSVTYGDLYLTLTRELGEAYRQGAALPPTVTPALVPSPTATSTPTVTPSPSPAPTATPSATLTPSPTQTPTSSPSPSPPPTATSTVRATRRVAPTSTATATATTRATRRITPTSTATATATARATHRVTPTPTASASPKATPCLGLSLLLLLPAAWPGLRRFSDRF
jgi:hypothetical protein